MRSCGRPPTRRPGDERLVGSRAAGRGNEGIQSTMCGIAGFADSPIAPPRTADADRSLLQTMCDVIRHRGPDDEGIRVEPGVGLGMRRLSIIDLSTGHQPIHNEDGTVWVVFNGEIYNYRELRRQLEAA